MLYNGTVVGVTFEPAKSNIPKLVDYLRSVTAKEGEIEPHVLLVHNPLNKFDSNAIEVHVSYGDVSYFVGHIPKTHNANILQYGIEKVISEVKNFHIDDHGNAYGLTIFVYENRQVFPDFSDKNLVTLVGV